MSDDDELHYLRPAHTVPLASARQHPENQKRKTRPAIRRSARWRVLGGDRHWVPIFGAVWELPRHGPLPLRANLVKNVGLRREGHKGQLFNIFTFYKIQTQAPI